MLEQMRKNIHDIVKKIWRNDGVPKLTLSTLSKNMGCSDFDVKSLSFRTFSKDKESLDRAEVIPIKKSNTKISNDPTDDWDP
ncbi:hypothetical protein RUM43_002575 [Polyplax serrata]|uniref:Uncharacterized protein n=1 Tax=Polyplax serrata TaxID=468196 RepID=A0AAN8NZ07_POLSC